MPLPTLFFTLFAYTDHEVTHVTTPPCKRGGRSNDQRSTYIRNKRKVKDDSLQNRIQGNWKLMSGSVRHEWGKLTHNDVEQIKGDVEVLAGKIQHHYGVAEAEARKQIEQWANKFHAQQTDQSSSNTSTN
jgi:uncharacterized protein YjbJ (UPF0337 family)